MNKEMKGGRLQVEQVGNNIKIIVMSTCGHGAFAYLTKDEANSLSFQLESIAQDIDITEMECPHCNGSCSDVDGTECSSCGGLGILKE